MARHGERIHKRKDGRWEGRYKTGNNESGRTLYASVYGKTYAEAKQKLYDAEKGLENTKKNCHNKKLFAYAVEQWFLTNRQSFKKSTAHKYEYLIEKHILPVLGTIRLNNITTIMLNEFADRKLECGSLDGNKGLSKSYIPTQQNSEQYYEQQYQAPYQEQYPQQSGSVVFCKQCATQFDSSQAYCPHCGTRR